MSSAIDEESISLLQNLRGAVLVSVLAERYTGLLGYTSVHLVIDDGRAVTFSLRAEDVGENAEVFVPVARASGASAAQISGDQFILRDFRIARAFRLQRREGFEWSAPSGGEYVGSSPRVWSIADVDADDLSGGRIVDAGVAFESTHGTILELCADSFPLLFQFRITVAASAIPTSRRVLID